MAGAGTPSLTPRLCAPLTCLQVVSIQPCAPEETEQGLPVG